MSGITERIHENAGVLVDDEQAGAVVADLHGSLVAISGTPAFTAVANSAADRDSYVEGFHRAVSFVAEAARMHGEAVVA